MLTRAEWRKRQQKLIYMKAGLVLVLGIAILTVLIMLIF